MGCKTSFERVPLSEIIRACLCITPSRKYLKTPLSLRVTPPIVIDGVAYHLVYLGLMIDLFGNGRRVAGSIRIDPRPSVPLQHPDDFLGVEPELPPGKPEDFADLSKWYCGPYPVDGRDESDPATAWGAGESVLTAVGW